jgi:3-hydroxyisobutyrate dehydrogenase-like beta-hydroxyacid dehydrogenase
MFLGILLYLSLHALQPQPFPSVNFQGHNLVVYDVQQEALDSLKQLGAPVSHSPQDVAAQVDCVITMLPNTAGVLEVYNGKNGILK